MSSAGANSAFAATSKTDGNRAVAQGTTQVYASGRPMASQASAPPMLSTADLRAADAKNTKANGLYQGGTDWY